MILAISGTPGTGKTAAAKILAKKLHANLVSISDIVSKIQYSWDKKRKTRIIDARDLQKTAAKYIIKNQINIIEGHMSHLLNAEMVVVLRCNPAELERRLKKKHWKKEKIVENIQAEILDEITIESMEKYGKKNVFEIETSRRNPESVALIIKKLLNNLKTKKYRAGQIDWSEKYKDYLLR